MAESVDDLKRRLMTVKEESEKVGLKLNIQKTKIMASGPITSWQIYRERVETVTDFILLGFKVSADGDCSHEIKRCLLLRRKVMTNLDSILKSRDITFPIKIHLVKAMVFLVVMYGCELLLLLSCFSCIRLRVTPSMGAHQVLLSLGFSRQEHWSGLPCPSPMHESEK